MFDHRHGLSIGSPCLTTGYFMTIQKYDSFGKDALWPIKHIWLS